MDEDKKQNGDHTEEHSGDDEEKDQQQEDVDLSVKHPLQNRWTMWFNAPQKATKNNSGVWSSNVAEIMTFGSVEDFWGLWNHLVPPSKLQNGANYHLFKEGVTPEWEDDFNSQGGKWLLSFPKKEQTMSVVDDAWLSTVLLIIGETFDEDGEEICGVVVSPRAKHYRLALWTKHAKAEGACKRIGAALKAALKLQAPLGYQVHSDAIKGGSSFRNAQMYTI